MVRLLPTFLTFLSAIAVSAAPLPSAETQPEEAVTVLACAFTCGSVCYQQSHISAALNKGYSLHQDGSDINNYPHRYNNYEGFDFPTPGPWYEYPIMASHNVYNGGSPGPDRVVFDGDGAFDLLITHTGASGNAFVACRRG
ncbi:ribonuclease T1 [Madurella fahalii]|uniref:ribonuclease T1 n=1 Tax=Madurella fahalii TaxID=1157608 RepID=A0ABQ0GAE4_9PEZI